MEFPVQPGRPTATLRRRQRRRRRRRRWWRRRRQQWRLDRCPPQSVIHPDLPRPCNRRPGGPELMPTHRARLIISEKSGRSHELIATDGRRRRRLLRWQRVVPGEIVSQSAALRPVAIKQPTDGTNIDERTIVLPHLGQTPREMADSRANFAEYSAPNEPRRVPRERGCGD